MTTEEPDGGNQHQHLEVDQVRETVVRLHRRSRARFPERRLTRVAAKLAHPGPTLGPTLGSPRGRRPGAGSARPRS